MKKRIFILFLFVCAAFAEFQAFSQDNNISDYFPEIKVIESNKPADGYFFFGSKGLTASNAVQYIAIVDNYGTPVFFRKMDKLTSSMRLLNDGRIAYMHGAPRRLYFLDDKLAVTDSLEVEGYQPDGHDWACTEDGHFLLLGKHKWTYDMSQIEEGGNTEAEIVDLIVQEFDENSNLLYTWNSADHFEITDGNENSPYLDFTERQIDYVHANAISVDSDTSFLISARHMDEITKVDRRDGEIIWRLGGKKNQFQFVNDNLRFSHQHSIRKLKNGNILLFDNGNLHPTQASSAVIYQLDEKNKTATLIERYYRDSMVYSNHAGAVQRLENGNVLTCWGPYWPSFTEFHPDGSTALEWDFTEHSFSPRIEKYNWKTTVFTTSEDSLEFDTWENDTLQLDLWVKNNVSEEIRISTIEKRTEFFGITNVLPVILSPGDSVKLSVWFYPENSETGYFDDVLTLAYDTDRQRIARQVNVFGSKIDNASPEAQIKSAFVNASSTSQVLIQLNEAVRNWEGVEFDYNSIDDYVIFKKENPFGADVSFDAIISSDNKLITVVSDSIENGGTYYISLKNGIADFSGNELISFSETITATAVIEYLSSNDDIIVFPNPVRSQLFVQTIHKDLNGKIEIYNQTGQLKSSETVSDKLLIEIDFSGFKPGMYFFTYETKNERITKKLIKY